MQNKSVIIVSITFTLMSAFASDNFQLSTFNSQLSSRALARDAQRAWRGGDFATAAELYGEALNQTQIEPALEKEIKYNAALANLKTGDYAKAASLFRSLAAGDAESAEGLGVALFNNDNVTNSVEKLKVLEEAAGAFQTALRSLPKNDARVENLSAAIAALPALRDEIRAAEIEKRYGSKQTDELLEEAIKTLRENYAAAAAAFADDSPNQISLLEAVATKQANDAMVWEPLISSFREYAQMAREKGGEDAEAFAVFMSGLEDAKARAESAVSALDNIDPAAFDAIRDAETFAFSMLTSAAPPPVVLAQAIISQSNALDRAVSAEKVRNPAEEQGVAMWAFDVFSKKYEDWLEQQGQQTDESEEPQTLDEAKRAEIDRLVKKTLGTHSLIAADMSPDDALLNEKTRVNAESSLEDMIKIMEHLPKPPQQQNNQKQDDRDNKDEQESPKNSDDSDSDDSSSDEADDDGENDENDIEETEPEDETEPEESSSSDDYDEQEQEWAEKLMEKILEQEKQREIERRNKQRNLPPVAGERDW
ncbi:MAG: hypothetical protein FWG05_03350 [Kiritimatiellaeota bacterium]|nr:hypothetical protein [Kiritimatiellota bacterium]